MIWFAIPVVALGAIAVKIAWDYFSGKEVVFLLHGDTEAGKSTIVSTLSRKEYEQGTMQHEKIDISEVLDNDFKAIVMIDVGGRDIHKEENEEVRDKFFKQNALKTFLYVFDAQKFDTQKEIWYGIEIYRDICQRNNVLFLAIGTRADKLEKEKSDEIIKKIRQELNVRAFVINAGDKDEVSVIFGDIFKLIQEKYQ